MVGCSFDVKSLFKSTCNNSYIISKFNQRVISLDTKIVYTLYDFLSKIRRLLQGSIEYYTLTIHGMI